MDIGGMEERPTPSCNKAAFGTSAKKARGAFKDRQSENSVKSNKYNNKTITT